MLDEMVNMAYYRTVKEKLLSLYRNSLFQNSLYPMLATGAMAGLGFFFWLLVARLFTDAQVGLAATLISVLTMVSTLSLLGFDTATVRFLANEKNRNRSINTSLMVVGVASALLAGLFVLLVELISPQLSFIRDDTTVALLFILFTTFASLNMFLHSVFLAYRKTKYTFWIDTIFSVIKIGLPLAFIPWGAFGIFAAAAGAQAIGFMLCIVALMRRFSYRPQFAFDRDILRRVWRYTTGNYVADAFNFLPLTVLPILIVNHLGAAQSAYYYIVMMVVNLLYTIPLSTMRALFAEGSHDEKTIPESVHSTLKTTTLLLLPAMLVLFIGGKLILLLFGTEYAAGGTTFLYIMTATAVFVAGASLFNALFRLTHHIKALVIRNAIAAISITLFVYLALPYGLTGVGVAYALGTFVGLLAGYVLFQRYAHTSHPTLAQRMRVSHLTRSAWYLLLETVWWPSKTLVLSKTRCARARYANHGKPPVTLLCYPDKPRTYHTLYKIAHRMGWRITNDPTKKADIVIHFEDTTQRVPQPVLLEKARTQKVLNKDCIDIGKKHVGKVFAEVFGYPIDLDPRTHTGTCVRKSDTNAVHDGCIVSCPTEPEEGYVYQKLVDTECGNDRVVDLRIPIFGNHLPFILKRYKRTSDIFDITVDVEFAEVEDILSKEERTNLITFAQKMGLDYGEVDALRDRHNGKLYIVDVNNTPAGPIGPIYRSRTMLARWCHDLCTAAQNNLLPKHATRVDIDRLIPGHIPTSRARV